MAPTYLVPKYFHHLRGKPCAHGHPRCLCGWTCPGQHTGSESFGWLLWLLCRRCLRLLALSRVSVHHSDYGCVTTRAPREHVSDSSVHLWALGPSPRFGACVQCCSDHAWAGVSLSSVFTPLGAWLGVGSLGHAVAVPVSHSCTGLHFSPLFLPVVLVVIVVAMVGMQQHLAVVLPRFLRRLVCVAPPGLVDQDKGNRASRGASDCLVPQPGTSGVGTGRQLPSWPSG